MRALPAETEEQMMADDYDYSDSDDQAQSNPFNVAAQTMSGQNKSVTVNGILRENVTLKCLDNITKSKCEYEVCHIWISG